VIEPRKNLASIPEALARVEGVCWVLVGKLGYRGEEILRQLEADCRRFNVSWLRRESLSESELLEAFERADAVLLPSQEEGFGLPALDGALLGRPLFLSDISPFREIGGEAAQYFDPSRVPETLAPALQAFLSLSTDEDWQQRSLASLARARAFSWEATADRFLQVYEAMGSAR
jgi:glycosyltransferase involved in cell wall biosynthesis